MLDDGGANNSILGKRSLFHLILTITIDQHLVRMAVERPPRARPLLLAHARVLGTAVLAEDGLSHIFRNRGCMVVKLCVASRTVLAHVPTTLFVAVGAVAVRLLADAEGGERRLSTLQHAYWQGREGKVSWWPSWEQ